MKSTGEVMGIDDDFGIAFSRGQMGAGLDLPLGKKFGGTVFISVKNKDKRVIVFIAKKLYELGFKIVATEGTAQGLRKHGIPVAEIIGKVWEKSRGNVVDRIARLEVDMIINTPLGKGPLSDNYIIRQQAIINRIPCFTTISAAAAAVNAIESLMRQKGLLNHEETLRQRLERSNAPAIFISVDKKHRTKRLLMLVRLLTKLKSTVYATKGTADYLASFGVTIDKVIPKIWAVKGSSILEHIEANEVAFILNIPKRRDENAVSDSFIIRRAAIPRFIPYLSSVEEAMIEIQQEKQRPLFSKMVKKLQEYHVREDSPEVT
jgi:hypothetical protein